MTSRSFSSPSRSTVKVSVSPGWWVRIETISAMPSVTRWPSRADDHVALLEAGVGGRGVVDDLVDLGAGAVALAGLHLGADDRVARLAGAQDLVGGDLDLLHRDGEADADVAGLAAGGAAGGGDRGVDPDHLAEHVDQRPTGVAGVDRGVGLHRVDVGRLVGGVAGGDRPLQRADDARRSPSTRGRAASRSRPPGHRRAARGTGRARRASAPWPPRSRAPRGRRPGGGPTTVASKRLPSWSTTSIGPSSLAACSTTWLLVTTWPARRSRSRSRSRRPPGRRTRRRSGRCSAAAPGRPRPPTPCPP